jgi:hypothetical protein
MQSPVSFRNLKANEIEYQSGADSSAQSSISKSFEESEVN